MVLTGSLVRDDYVGRPPNCQLCTSTAAYRPGVRTARAASRSGARSSTAVPSQAAPSSDSSGPYAISSFLSDGEELHGHSLHERAGASVGGLALWGGNRRGLRIALARLADTCVEPVLLRGRS